MSRAPATIGARHLVEELTVALRFASIEPLGRSAEDVGRELVEDLLPAVEQALDDVAPGNHTRCIETAEVDLGSISARGVSEADRARLRELLAAALGPEPHPASGALAVDGTMAPTPELAAASAATETTGKLDLPRRASALSPAVAQSLLGALREGRVSALMLVTTMAADELPELIAALAVANGVDVDAEAAASALVDASAPEQAAAGAIERLLAGLSPRLETGPRPQPEPGWLRGYRLAEAMLAGPRTPRSLKPPHDTLDTLGPAFLRVQLASKPDRAALLLLAVERDARPELAARLGLGLEIRDLEHVASRAIQRALDVGAGDILAAAARQQPALLAAQLRAIDDQAAVRRVVAALDEPGLAGLALALGASPSDLASLEASLADHQDMQRQTFWQTVVGVLRARSAAPGWAGDVADRLGLRPLQPPPSPPTLEAVRAAYAAYGEVIAGDLAPGALATATGTMRRSLPSLLSQLKAGLTNGTPPVVALTVGRAAHELRKAIIDILAASSAADVGELERTLTALEAEPRAAQRFAAVLAAVADDAPLDLQAPPSPPSLAPLEAYLAGGPETREAAILARAVSTTRPPLAATLVRAHAEQAASRLGRLLGNDARARLLATLQPETAAALAAATERLAGALLNLVADPRELVWAVALETSATGQRVEPGDVVARLVDVLAERRGIQPTIVAGELRAELERGATAVDPVGEALARSLAPPAVGRAPAARATTDAEAWTTDDAGAVLLAPYLPRLFEHEGLMVEGVLAEGQARSAARALVDLAVWGEPLAARHAGRGHVAGLLAGVPPEAPPMPAELAPTAAALVDSLLAAMIANWGALGQTSVAGLREAFLRRPGVLRDGADGWRLAVEPRAYDMLLDRLPWPYGVVGHRWMPRPLFVEWR